MQVNCKTVKTVIIEFTEEEYKIFRDGIGNTSEYARIDAGMTEKQAQFFGTLFSNLPSTSLV